MIKDRPHDEVLAECFRNDPNYAQELLDEARRNGSSAEVAIVLRQMALAFGQVTYDANFFSADRSLTNR